MAGRTDGWVVGAGCGQLIGLGWLINRVVDVGWCWLVLVGWLIAFLICSAKHRSPKRNRLELPIP